MSEEDLGLCLFNIHQERVRKWKAPLLHVVWILPEYLMINPIVMLNTCTCTCTLYPVPVP